MAEEIVYSDNNVRITTARVIIGSTTYALRNITSVKMEFTEPDLAFPNLLALIGLISLYFPWWAFTESGWSIGSKFLTLLVPLALFAGGFLWAVSLNTEYYISISSASGEGRVLSSNDRAYIEKIVVSINDAIVRYQ